MESAARAAEPFVTRPEAVTKVILEAIEATT